METSPTAPAKNFSQDDSLQNARYGNVNEYIVPYAQSDRTPRLPAPLVPTAALPPGVGKLAAVNGANNIFAYPDRMHPGFLCI